MKSIQKKWRLWLACLLSGAILIAQQPVAQGPQASNAAAWLITGSGTAGSAATGVVTVQGIASGTPAPISGTVTANAGTGPFPVAATFQSTSTYASTVYDLSATAATNVKNGAGNLYRVTGFNPNVTTCYLQFYNSTSATLGTSPLHPIGILAGATFSLTLGPWNFSMGISTGETTTATGSTQCSSAMPIAIDYQ